MSWFFLFLMLPFFFALLIPPLHKLSNPKVHTGWFVLGVPLVLFIELLLKIPIISSGKTILHHLPWIPDL